MNCFLCHSTHNEKDFFIKLSTTLYNEVHVCGDCIEKLYNKKEESHSEKRADTKKNGVFDGVLPSTCDIVSHLDRYIISQGEAKKTLAVAVRNHYKRLTMNAEDQDIVEKSNILLMGESGTGKTAMIRRIAEFVDVPLVIFDSSVITTDGYMGDSIDSAIKTLYRESNNNALVAECGIVFFDELDKKRKSPDAAKGKDVSGECVQTSMLKMLEGKEVKVDKDTYINTRNILFIGGGAFVDLKEIIKNRLNMNRIGFTGQSKDNDNYKIEDVYKEVNSDDLIEYGLIPELIGRFPIVTYTRTLSKDDIQRIMVEPEDCIIKQFQKLFKVDGINLKFDKRAVEFIASKVLDNKTGVRGVRKVVEAILEDIQFNIERYKKEGVTQIGMTKNKSQDYIKPNFRFAKQSD